MSFWYLIAASGLSFLWLLVHLFAGGREIATPLLKSSDLDPIVRDTLYLCWHFTSVAIAGMSGFFLLAALTDTNAYAFAGLILSAGFAIVGIGIVFMRKGHHLQLPQGWLFLPVAALGLAGLYL